MQNGHLKTDDNRTPRSLALNEVYDIALFCRDRRTLFYESLACNSAIIYTFNCQVERLGDS